MYHWEFDSFPAGPGPLGPLQGGGPKKNWVLQNVGQADRAINSGAGAGLNNSGNGLVGTRIC